MINLKNETKYRLSEDEWEKLLQKEYIDNHKTIKDVAQEYDTSQMTVRKYLKVVGIAIRPKGAWMIGRKFSEETKRKIADRMRGKKYSKETKRKVSIASSKRRWSDAQREKFIKSFRSNPNNRGRKPWNWQGKSSKQTRIRKSAKYKEWRLAVYQRDGFRCVGCGDERGHNLQAHHKMSFAGYPDSRFDVSNGVTLCKKCHGKMHPDLGFVGIGA